MKKLFLILIPILFIGCTEANYIDDIDSSSVCLDDFINLRTIYNTSRKYIKVDKNTDVLYYYEYFPNSNGGGQAITPIMKADGTCLTYTEWKAKGNN